MVRCAHLFRNGKECRVCSEREIAREGLQDYFEEILVPTEDISEVKNGKKRVSTRRMYSGYIFVKMIMNDETWHLVKNTARITGFLGGSANKPSPLPAKDIEAIKSKMEAGSEAPRPRVEFEVGGSVRIKNGPFTDFNGIIEEVNYDKNRLRLWYRSSAATLLLNLLSTKSRRLKEYRFSA